MTHEHRATRYARRVVVLRAQLAQARAGNQRAQELRLLKLARRTRSAARLIADLEQEVAAQKRHAI